MAALDRLGAIGLLETNLSPESLMCHFLTQFRYELPFRYNILWTELKYTGGR